MNWNEKILFFLLFCFALPSNSHANRCSLVNDHLRSRPNTQAAISSPTGHFLIHYDLDGEHAPSQIDNNSNLIPDYVDEVAIIADSSRNVLVNLMGFLPEIQDSDGVYDIYLQNRPSGYYGVNYQDEFIAGASYIIIDEEYEQGDFLTSGINTMRLTVAHEFFHAIQRAYRSAPTVSDTYFWEMSATWIEDIIVPDGNDYLLWVDNFFDDTSQILSDYDGYSLALFGHYLSKIVDNNYQINQNDTETIIMREIWERYQTINNPLQSMKYILSNNFQIDFENAWLDFCSRNIFNGTFTDMNNNLYYHIDQVDLQPPTYAIDYLYDDYTFNGLVVLEEAIGTKALYVYNLAEINIVHSTIPGDSNFDYSIAIKSSDPNLNKLYMLNDSQNESFYVEEGDYLYLTYTANNNIIMSGDITFNTDIQVLYGDANLDQTINVVDIVLLVSFLFGETSFNQLQLDSTDMNEDQQWNVVDVVNIINIIFN